MSIKIGGIKMIFERFESVEKFTKEVKPFLEKNEAVNNLPLGVLGEISRNIDRYGDEKPFLGCVIDDKDDIVLVTIMTPPHNLIITGDRHHLEEAIIEAVNYLINANVEIPGVIGAPNVAGMFVNLWTQKTGSNSEVTMDQRIYRLDKVNDIVDNPGKLRKANFHDFDIVKVWVNNFVEDCFGERVSDERAEKTTKHLIDSERLFIWDNNGPVSMACKMRPTKNGIVVGEVYTPPEHRKKGYGTSCVAALSQMLLDEGYKFCSLYTDLSNPTSNSIYMKIGYKPIEDSTVYSIN